MKISLNARTLIRLNPRGEEVFDRYYQKAGLDPVAYRRLYLQPDGRMKMELWMVMAIFGSACYMGPPSPIDIEIEIDAAKK